MWHHFSLINHRIVSPKVKPALKFHFIVWFLTNSVKKILQHRKSNWEGLPFYDMVLFINIVGNNINIGNIQVIEFITYDADCHCYYTVNKLPLWTVCIFLIQLGEFFSFTKYKFICMKDEFIGLIDNMISLYCHFSFCEIPEEYPSLRNLNPSLCWFHFC